MRGLCISMATLSTAKWICSGQVVQRSCCGTNRCVRLHAALRAGSSNSSSFLKINQNKIYNSNVQECANHLLSNQQLYIRKNITSLVFFFINNVLQTGAVVLKSPEENGWNLAWTLTLYVKLSQNNKKMYKKSYYIHLNTTYISKLFNLNVICFPSNYTFHIHPKKIKKFICKHNYKIHG